MHAILDVIAERFGRAGITYLVVGGCAVNMHGYTRHTDDLDVMIELKHADAAAACLTPLGYREQRSDTRFSRLIPDSPLNAVVDLLYADESTFSKMMAASLSVRTGSVEHRVPAAEHLIAMKLHALLHGREQRRSKDTQDIIELARACSLDLFSSDFEALCLRFANEKILRGIRALASIAP